MTRSREENAFDLVREEAQRMAFRSSVDAWARERLVSEALDRGLDEGEIEAFLEGNPALLAAGEERVDPAIAASEVIAMAGDGIREVCLSRDLVCTPNLMGRPLDAPDDALEP